VSRPSYVMSASVGSGNRVRDFHGTDDQSVQALMLHPPTFRRSGFDLSVPDVPRPGPDNSWQSGGDRKLLRVYQDGTVLFRVAADADFLGWGVEERVFQRSPRLNPVAVAELHASFVYFYREMLGRLTEPVYGVSLKLKLDAADFGAGRIFLTEYYDTKRFDPTFIKKRVLQTNPATASVTAGPESFEKRPDAVAFLILAAFAAMFDMPPDEIPFTRKTPEGSEVDIASIRDLRG
jgi:hypothetical protein